VQHRWRNSPHCCNSQPSQALAGGSMILFVYLQMADSLLCFCSAATDGFACGCRGFNLLCASLLGLLECSLLRWCSTISMSESVTRCSGSTWRLQYSAYQYGQSSMLFRQVHSSVLQYLKTSRRTILYPWFSGRNLIEDSSCMAKHTVRVVRVVTMSAFVITLWKQYRGFYRRMSEVFYE
jgi:hypothetical protein